MYWVCKNGGWVDYDYDMMVVLTENENLYKSSVYILYVWGFSAMWKW